MTVEAAGMPEAVITEAMIESMRQRIGVELRIDECINNDIATRLSIARFAAGIGDTNPLWTDSAYAGASRLGGLVAPPTWVLCCFSGLQFGWPGLGSFHAGSDLRFHRLVREGDRIVPSCTYEGFDGPQPSRFAERMVIDRFLNRYRNQRHELVAEVHWRVWNFERQTAKGKGDGAAVEVPHRWTEEEVARIEADCRAERPRGATPRLWEDVNIGDELDPVTKGPVGTTDEVAFVASGAAPIPRLAAHRAALDLYDRHPAWSFRDSVTGAREPIYAVHYNREAARAMGVSMQYDVGFQRQCWQIHLGTHWMGDDAWIKRASAQYRSFVYLGDVIRLGGVVTGKYVDDDDETVVAIRTHARNQRGDDVMPGELVVALPSRHQEGGPVQSR